MNTISRNDLRQLATMNGEYVVSIYMPASVGAENRQNPVRFKNLLRVAGQKMLGRKIGEPAIQKMTVSARTLLDQTDLWQELSQGLAVFISRDNLRVWPLPFTCEEICVVGKHVYLLPLLAWETSDAPYFVLAVSQNAVRLLAGTRARLEEVTLPGLPTDLTTALHYDTRQGTLQMHSGTPRLAGKEGVVFHGQGGEVDLAKQELTSYFREIDRAVDLLLDLDVQGAAQVRMKFRDAVCLFLLPPSYAALEARIRGRGQDDEGTIRRRLDGAWREVNLYKDYDYAVVNADLEACVDDVKCVIRAARLRTSRMSGRAGAILATFQTRS